jgi:hypothetical protein
VMTSLLRVRIMATTATNRPNISMRGSLLE